LRVRFFVPAVLIFVGPLLAAAEKAEFKADDPPGPQVRLVAIKTDIIKRYRYLVPALPFPPFTTWRRWLTDHIDAVHCILEWRTESGEWYYGELRSTRTAPGTDRVRVGWGEFTGTGYDAYGIYISKGRVPRAIDPDGSPVEVTLDEAIPCDYRRLEKAIRQYGAREFVREAGIPGNGCINRNLGGPGFKPSQNSNTMVNYVLKQCGVTRKSPQGAVGWDTIPHFPHSTDKDTFDYDDRP
jgi:hypothetical protein